MIWRHHHSMIQGMQVELLLKNVIQTESAQWIPTWWTMKAVGEVTVSGLVAVMPYWTGGWCRGALGTVMTCRASGTCDPTILRCGWPGPRDAVVSCTTLAWCNTFPRRATEEAWWKRKKEYPLYFVKYCIYTPYSFSLTFLIIATYWCWLILHHESTT